MTAKAILASFFDSVWLHFHSVVFVETFCSSPISFQPKKKFFIENWDAFCVWRGNNPARTAVWRRGGPNRHKILAPPDLSEAGRGRGKYQSQAFANISKVLKIINVFTANALETKKKKVPAILSVCMNELRLSSNLALISTASPASDPGIRQPKGGDGDIYLFISRETQKNDLPFRGVSEDCLYAKLWHGVVTLFHSGKKNAFA